MADPLYVGADWCSGSWLAAAFDGRKFDHATVFEEIGQLWARYEDAAERIFVAVPIGLVEDDTEGRVCEKLAREALGPRRDSIATSPCREAARKRRYRTAKRVNERKTGRSLSRQAFATSEGITEVDELVQKVPEARHALVESRPEVCFRAFAGEPLSHPKRTAAGYAERMRTLVAFDNGAAPNVQAAAEATGGHEVTVEDVLDALALGYSARPGPGELRSLPREPQSDPTGLPMRIVYRAETALGDG